MAASKTSTRIGLFALLLGVITLSLFGSLLGANRALATADLEATASDARGAALATERELRLRAEALNDIVGPLTPGPSSRIAPDTTADGFDAVWVLDRQRRVVWQRESAHVGGADPAVLIGLAADVIGSDAPAVRVVHSPDAARAGILLGAPVAMANQLLGVSVGFMTGARLLAILDSAIPRPRITLRSGGRILASISHGEGGESFLRAAATVRIPGDPLEVDVVHAQSGRALRTALWLLGVVALSALLVGLARERRQAVSLAQRTAELERLYQEVARSNRMKSEFLANVSHELRTPLNAIVGFVEMLREGVYGEMTPRQALPVDRIAASATHLRHLVDRLLDIAKIAAGRLEVHAEPLVLRPFVLNVASEMESLVAERGLALSIGVGPVMPRIRTDQTHLRQILINLIGNAVKYTPSGMIKVNARLTGDGQSPVPSDDEPDPGPPPDPTKVWVALQVSDTGVGIAAGDQERIFDEFEQVNAGARTDSARRGTGLGLAISRRLARLIGGDLTVRSEVGRGSVFTVWLPVETADTKSD